MHWLTKPGTSWPEMDRITIQASKELRAIPGRPQLRRPHRPGPDHGRGGRHVLRRELDQRRSRRSTTTRRVARDPGDGRRLPRPLSRRADLSEGADPGGADRIAARPSSCASIGRDLDVLRDKAGGESRKPSKGSTGIVDLHVELPDEDPADRGQGRSRPGPALRPQAGRCAASRGHAWSPARKSATSTSDNRTYDVHVWSIPEARDSLTDIREHADRHAQRRPRAAAGGGRRAHRADAQRHQARERSSGASTSAPTCAGRDLGSVVADVEAALGDSRFPAGVPRRAAGRVHRAAGGPEAAHADLRSSPRS